MTTVAMIRRGIIAAPRKSGPSPSTRQAVTAALELARLGFACDPEQLMQLAPAQLTELLGSAAVAIGADRRWQPLFPGFPKQVYQESDWQLLATALAHYHSRGEFRPADIDRLSGGPLCDVDFGRLLRKLTVTTLTASTITSEWGSVIAPSGHDREFIRDVADHIDTAITDVFSATDFRNGEQLAAALVLLSECGYQPATCLAMGFTKARHLDDVLRCILSTYCRDVERGVDLQCSATSPVNMRPLPRESRRLIAAQLSRCATTTDMDMVYRRRKLWRRVLKFCHPYDYATDAAARHVLDIIFDNTPHRTTNAQVECALETGDVPTALALLRHSPGGLLRRVHHMLRLIDTADGARRQAHTEALLATLRATGHQVQLSTLISAYNGIANGEVKTKVRRLRGRTILARTASKPVSTELVTQALSVLEECMIGRLRDTTTPPDTLVPTCNTVPVQLIRRGASASHTNLIRGARLPLGEPRTLRLFLHWYGDDIDLAVCIADADCAQQLAFVDYTNLFHNPLRESIAHSGDVIYGPHPDGACEFIDIRLANTTEPTLIQQLPEARYLIASVISFSGTNLARIDACAGAMLVHADDNVSLFEPRAVATAAQLNAVSTSAVPFVVDLHTNELIWLDSSIGFQEGGYNAGGVALVDLVAAELELLRNQLSIGRLLELWAAAHNAETTSDPTTDSDGTASVDLARRLLDGAK
ncbi:MAG: hypothetical protein Q4D85_14495 [Corynebacterium sp.]|uniref:hypothetical protein n=1 Tax=Corynebacterium sp. TaxID=1720 RepID=UPI0026DCBF11|nr:hypothetical protein [Corynebacterium sp.]MDO5099942.1 hypothetical protein [Corynebacterium sp.]